MVEIFPAGDVVVEGFEHWVADVHLVSVRLLQMFFVFFLCESAYSVMCDKMSCDNLHRDDVSDFTSHSISFSAEKMQMTCLFRGSFTVNILPSDT